MRHPLRRLAGQGAWYAVANVLVKLAGLILLPLYADTSYLTIEAFGLWGVLELTVQLAVALVGLQLGAGLIRFHPEYAESDRVVSAVWWLTVGLGVAGAGLALLAVRLLVEAGMQRLFMLLILYIFTELLLAVPLAFLRVRGRAFAYSVLGVSKLMLVVVLNVIFLAVLGRGLTGIVEGFLLANAITLLIAVVSTRLPARVRVRFDRRLVRTLVGFSAPLVVAGIGSMVLNAGDRYMLTLLSTDEQLAIYYMAAKFGSVVNMFGAQPLALAFLPLLFTLAVPQREDVIRLLMRYLTPAFGLLVVGLSLFSGPVLHVMGADPIYQTSVPLVPWVALGFAAFGLSLPFEGVITLHRRTGIVSIWVMVAAVVNIVLNAILIPLIGAAGAAAATFLAYGFLFWGRYISARRLLPVPGALGNLFGVGTITIAIAVLGSLLPEAEGWGGWALRAGGLAVWTVVVLGTGGFSVVDARAAWRALRVRSGIVPDEPLAADSSSEPSDTSGGNERERHSS